MRKPDHFNTHKITDQKITRDLLKAMSRLQAIHSYAEKLGIKIDDVRDAHEDAAMQGVKMPIAHEVGPVELTVVIDFSTGEIAFKL